ncbi:hypothetical protein [Labrys monachus]|uniref:Uncharacterized protein n=1 Tax=Labrys monachus TaxID=217067 RepID=A0ABU0FDG2_9HYPH|nr:hypothetical protein [Labrys monachus]MDQ0392645.1 hypothetical protein [Labrys monachus]
MTLNYGKYRYVLDTVESICKSSAVDECIIGITAQSDQRRRAYRDAKVLQYPHFVVLIQDLKREDALGIEEYLQAQIKQPAGKAIYKKYHPDRRDGMHRRSVGGSDNYTDGYTVYLTWR